MGSGPSKKTEKEGHNTRTIQQVIQAKEQIEAVGVTIRKSIGGKELPYLDPFLVLEEFKLEKPGGYPDHPHRGFESVYICCKVTYMMSGVLEYENCVGNKGVLKAGDIQWLTIARGNLHCMMPKGENVAHGLNLWINLNKDNKKVEPDDQKMLRKYIPKIRKDGISVKVIAGESPGMKSPVYTRTPTLYLEFTLQPGAMVTQAIPLGWNGFVYVFTATPMFGPKGRHTYGTQHQTLVLSKKGKTLLAKNKKDVACRFVLIVGQPLNEPVVRNAAFVMNKEEELQQALEDYKNSKNGFEPAKDWHSSVTNEA